MDISRIIAELGPQLVARELGKAREHFSVMEGLGASEAELHPLREKLEFLQTVAPEIVNAASDGFRAYEVNREQNEKTRWVADTAAHLLFHHQGEALDADVDNAVRIAKRIADQAKRLCNVGSIE